jgi:hypothetical protein
MGLHAFFTFGNIRRGFAVTVLRSTASRTTLGCNQFDSLAQRCQDETVEALREFISSPGFSSKGEGPYSWLAPRTQIAPRLSLQSIPSSHSRRTAAPCHALQRPRRSEKQREPSGRIFSVNLLQAAWFYF